MTAFCEKLAERMKADLDKGEVSNILHEVGNLRALLEKWRFLNELQKLNSVFSQSCQMACKPGEDGNIDPKFDELSFQKTTQIFCGLNPQSISLNNLII